MLAVWPVRKAISHQVGIGGEPRKRQDQMMHITMVVVAFAIGTVIAKNVSFGTLPS